MLRPGEVTIVEGAATLSNTRAGFFSKSSMGGTYLYFLSIPLCRFRS